MLDVYTMLTEEGNHDWGTNVIIILVDTAILLKLENVIIILVDTAILLKLENAIHQSPRIQIP